MSAVATVSFDTRPTLLSVLAHPDDESFGMGGTLARYAWSGANVHLICATGGEEGTVDPALLQGYGSIAELRAAELQRAAEALGLTSVINLGYRDSGMPGAPSNSHPDALAAQPLERVTARVCHEIRRLRPQVVVTFDPIGGYRHPDHIAIHNATVAAFHAAGDPAQFPGDLPAYAPQKLYYHTFGRRLLRAIVAVMPLFGQDPRRFGRNQDVDIASLAEVEFPIHARVDTLAVNAAREAAVRSHVSQGGASAGPVRQLLGRAFALVGGYETFSRAFPEAPPGLSERDLFAGVVI
jgi:LmbE family N-acetylglucosaminyl deacetylase